MTSVHWEEPHIGGGEESGRPCVVVAREREIVAPDPLGFPTWVLRDSKLVVDLAAGDGVAGFGVVSCNRHKKQTLNWDVF